MRPLKFRAWDGEQMLPAQDLSQSREYWTWLGLRDVTLMQFTGLKDENGREIYEGDIIKHSRCPGGFIIEARIDEGNGRIDFARGFMWKLSACEVIGNRYENPELLNSENEKPS